MTDIQTLSTLAQSISGRRAAALRLEAGVVSLVLDVSDLAAEARADMQKALREALLATAGVTDVRIAMTAEKTAMTIIAVASGKGGVGKSTLATNLAIALKQQGLRVGIVDADIYGPSQPLLLGHTLAKPEARGKQLIPVDTAYGVPMLSMGQLAKEGQAIAWRGPMAGNALSQLVDADWTGIDTLVVDMPPGTGDVQLSMMQRHKPTGVVIVSTPQDLALIDASRAINLFEQAAVPIIGIVENMAGYICPHCGESSDPFGIGGAEATAAKLGIAFLGRIPLSLALREASDAGTPPAAGNDDLAKPFALIAGRISEWLSDRG